MKNCIILGSGRSGTSMLGGILHNAGYFMGDNLYPPSISNPKGFFENPRINRINELILSKYDINPYSFLKGLLCATIGRLDYVKGLKKPLFKSITKRTIYYPGNLQRWLMSIPPEISKGRKITHPSTYLFYLFHYTFLCFKLKCFISCI